MTRTQVTVILPAKDAGPFIGTTLATLARQFDDPDALKLVAIDDGSADDTGEQMRGAASRFGSAELLRNETPVGLASARNQGLAHVDSDLYCFVDGDDWMAPGRLASLAEAMYALGCDFVRTDHVTVTEGRRQLVRAPHPWRGTVCTPRDAILPDDDTTMVDYPYAWAGMFHRRLIDDGLAAFPEGLFTAEDRPWIWRLHLTAASFAVVDAPALLYRRGVTNSLTQIADRRQLDFLPAFTQTLEIVAADEHADLYMPKAVWTTLAVCAHHLRRSRAMTPALRTELRRGVRQLIDVVPPGYVDDALRRMSEPRRRMLARFTRGAR
ncbi:MAG TPA: glycosyltransferase family 2 protein [Microbacterium sp.]|nr:glycosyltransferase family 2 protein [Microbacterium sp.]